MYGMTLYWADKQKLRLNYYPDNGEVESLFREIAEENSNKMTYYKYRETFKKSIN